MSFSSRTRHIALIAGSAITPSCALAQGVPGLWSNGFFHTSDASTTLTPLAPNRVLASSSDLSINFTKIDYIDKRGGIVDLDTSNLDTPAAGLPQRSITSTFHDDSTEIGRVVCQGKHFTGRPPLLGNRSIACDFSSSGAIAVEWRFIDESGIVLAQGLSNGATLSCDDLSDYPAGDSSSYSIGAGKATFKEFTCVKRTGSARVYSTAGPVLVDDVATISFRPIWCITSPCPGDGLGISRIDISTSNLAQLVTGNPVSSWSWGVCNTGSKGTNRLTVHGTEGTKITEAPAADLDDDGQLDSVIGAGSVGGIAGGVIAGIVIARPTLAQNTEPTGISFRKNYVGHVTLIKQRTAGGLTTTITTQTDPLTGQTFIQPDFSAIGSTEYEVTGYGPNGEEIGSAFACCATGIYQNLCPNGSYAKWVFFPPHWYFQGCITPSDFTLPGGTVLSGVATLRFGPVAGASLLTDVSQIEILDDAPATTITPIQVGQIEVITAPPVGPVTCDTIDFNGDSLFPDDADLVEFLTVLSGGECSTGACNDIDFNNDGLFPDDTDLISFLTVLAGGSCS